VTDTLTTISARRRPKGDKRERTKAKLIEAASALIRERGFEHTTLAAVAERAGMTTGAVYGNFKNRDELFAAVADIRGAPIIPETWPGMSFADLMGSMARAVIAAIPQRRAAVQGSLAFHAYTLTNEDARQRRLARTKTIYDVASQQLGLFPEDQLPMAPHLLVRVLHTLTDGLVLQRLVTPELIPDEVIFAAYAAFVVKS